MPGPLILAAGIRPVDQLVAIDGATVDDDAQRRPTHTLETDSTLPKSKYTSVTTSPACMGMALRLKE